MCNIFRGSCLTFKVIFQVNITGIDKRGSANEGSGRHAVYCSCMCREMDSELFESLCQGVSNLESAVRPVIASVLSFKAPGLCDSLCLNVACKWHAISMMCKLHLARRKELVLAGCCALPLPEK